MDKKFIERLKIAIGTKSVRSFADVCNLSEAVIRKYLAGSEPTRPALVAITRASNVSLEWLATGEGELYTSSVKSYSKAKEHVVDFWFDYRENEEERFWGRFYPTCSPSGAIQDQEDISNTHRIANIDDQPDMTIAGTIKKFVYGYNRGIFGMGLIPDWVFTLLPSLSESDFEKWVREGIKNRIESGLPVILEIVPLEQLPVLDGLRERLIQAVTKVCGASSGELYPKIWRSSIYPILIRLGANNTRLPEVEEIESLLRLAIKLGSISPPQSPPEAPTINSPEKHNTQHQKQE